MTHPEKWGITKAGQQAVDAVKKGVNEFVEGTSTDLDDKALAGLKSGYNTAKNAVTNTNAYKNAKNVASDVRRSTEAMQRRDEANRTANKAASAAESYREKAKTSTGADKQRYTRLAKQAEETEKRNRSQAGQESVNANGYATRARNTAKSSVTNTVDMYKNRIGNAIDDTKLNINRRITNNNTQVDNYLRNAVREASKGNFKAAGNGLRNAGRQAVRETGDAVRRGVRNAGETISNTVDNAKTAINKRIDDSDTVADNMAREAFRNLREGNTNLAKGYARGAVRATTNDVKKALGNAVDNVGNTVNKLKNAAEGYDAYKDLERTNRKFNSVTDNPSKISDAERRLADARSKEGGATGSRLAETTSAAKKNSIEAARTASKSVKDIYDNAMRELGDIRDKYGQNSPQYLQALVDIKQDAIQAVKDTGSQIRTAFQNAPGTVTNVMSSGAEWISNTFDGLISKEEQILMSPEAEERQRQQQNTKLSGRYTDFDYENDEAERRRRESQRR